MRGMQTAIARRGFGALPARRASIPDRIDQAIFNAVYDRALVYNTCWEDPAVDRRALAPGPDDTLLVITSAGCNALDYALLGPRRVHAVDANPRQTALLELKLAGIARLGYGDFFEIFGRGRHREFATIYRDALREALSPFARHFWDERLGWFAHEGRGLYFHGLSGWVARAFHAYTRRRPGLRDALLALFRARSLDEQRELYAARIAPALWSPLLNWTLSRQVTLSLLGVPHPQRREVVAQHAGGVAAFVRDAIEYIACELPTRSNYFYALYVHGGYEEDCCPEYLTRAGFAALKGGLAGRVEPVTTTVTEFLRRHPTTISRFVLLDHMDWMAGYHPVALEEEWDCILERAAPGARILFRSAHAAPAWLEGVRAGPWRAPLREQLHFHDEWARALAREDRVHTYAGFHIADLRA
jgi:S-adenosylmethionine-diacylglycerol 3-amino-3-carboxypropyl transferase